MRFEDYLVTTTQDKATPRKFVWHASERTPLGHPARFFLERTAQGVVIKKFGTDAKDQGKAYLVDPEFLKKGSKIKIRYKTPEQADRALMVSIRTLEPIRAAYLPSQRPQTEKQGSLQLFLFWGTRYYLLGFKALGGKFIGNAEGQEIFRLSQKSGGYQLTALTKGVRFKVPHEARKELPVGVPHLLTESQMMGGGILWHQHWWRFNQSRTPDPLKVDELDLREAREASAFKKMMWIVAGLFVAFAVLLRTIPPIEVKKEVEPETISLKTPKIIPLIEAKKKPKTIELKPKPEPKPEPKPKAAPAKSPPKPAPVPVVKAPPPPDPAVIAAQQREAQRQQLAKSLSFLNTQPSKAAPTFQGPVATNQKYVQSTPVDAPKTSNLLSQSSSVNKVAGPITTKGSRNIDAAVTVGNEKGLNDVQGRVALSTTSGASGDLSGIGGKGMSVTGPGSLSDPEIEKVLQKFLPRFQYCYEKALLTDTTLAGIVSMQWSIQQDGSTSNVKVIRSQIKSEPLEKCMTAEISKIRFTSPKGGYVNVSYPFSFTSTSL